MNPMLILIVALTLTFTYVDASRQSKCGPNEIWTECMGCELKCGQSEFTPCTLQCDPPGCYCPPYDGFRRNSARKCVAISECPKNRRFPKNTS